MLLLLNDGVFSVWKNTFAETNADQIIWNKIIMSNYRQQCLTLCRNSFNTMVPCWYAHQIGTQIYHSAIVRKVWIYCFQRRIRRRWHHLLWNMVKSSQRNLQFRKRMTLCKLLLIMTSFSIKSIHMMMQLTCLIIELLNFLYISIDQW